MSATTPTDPQTHQRDPAPSNPSPKGGVVLHRGDKRSDLVPVLYPSLPVRIEIFQAFRRACGYLSDEEEEPSGPFIEADATACLWASLGVCWAGPDVGLPSFRSCGRDVVSYGEAVFTALYFAGYLQASELAKAGRELMVDYVNEMLLARKEAEQGFRKAKRQR